MRLVGRARWAALASVLSWAPSAGAAPPPAGAALTAPAVAASFSVVRQRLGNGLRVVLSEDQREPRVVVCLTLAAGSREEAPDRPGVAALLAELLGGDGAQASAASVAAAVGRSEVELGVDQLQLWQSLPPSALEAALRLQAGRLRWPAPEPELVVGLRERLSARRAAGDATYAAAESRLRQLVFQGDWRYGHAPLPDAAALGAVQLPWLKAFFDSNVRPQNTVLSVVGAFDPALALRWIERELGTVPSSRAGTEHAIPPAPRQTSERLSVLVDPIARVPRVFYGWATPGARSTEQRALGLAVRVLARSEQARLRTRLLAEGRLAREVSAWLFDQSGPGLFAVQLTLDPRVSVDRAQKALVEELGKLAAAGPTRAELATAKADWSAQLAERLASFEGRALELGKQEASFGDARALSAEFQEIDAISTEDLRLAVRRYLSDTRRSSVEVYPEGWVQDEAAPAVARRHVVKPGENLSTIARRYGTTLASLSKSNRLHASGFIFPGQELAIPAGAVTGTAGPPRYRVKRGDTLSTIAKRQGISSAALMRANRLRPGQPIIAGQSLLLPAPDKQRAGQRTQADKTSARGAPRVRKR